MDHLLELVTRIRRECIVVQPQSDGPLRVAVLDAGGEWRVLSVAASMALTDLFTFLGVTEEAEREAA